MPELPEVEAWRRGLQGWLGGRVLNAVDLRDAAVVRPRLSTRPGDRMAGGEQWLAGLVGHRVDGLHRVGKRLGLQCGPIVALIHLGMTGRFHRGHEPPAAARVGFHVEGEPPVWFVDQRRFGCVAPLASLADLAEGLGPDALSPLEGPALAARFRGGRAIKVALLDQQALAGLGNIHAAEALWRAGIAPDRPVNQLSPEAWTRLAESIHRQLLAALDDIPVEPMDFVYVSEGGENPFAVYGRAGQPCPRCGESVEREVQAGRSTFSCPSCQPR